MHTLHLEVYENESCHKSIVEMFHANLDVTFNLT
jgi:hypothetical protein